MEFSSEQCGVKVFSVLQEKVEHQCTTLYPLKLSIKSEGEMGTQGGNYRKEADSVNIINQKSC
jgi:hypothetical protein